jgi:soluble lytic murein transglycosylase-like protein
MQTQKVRKTIARTITLGAIVASSLVSMNSSFDESSSLKHDSISQNNYANVDKNDITSNAVKNSTANNAVKNNTITKNITPNTDAGINIANYLSEENKNELLVDNILDTMKIASEVIDKYLIKASIKEESNFIPMAKYKSKTKKARTSVGLMQIMEPAWKKFGEGNYKINVYNPGQNISAGVKYYLWLENFVAKYNPSWSRLTLEQKQNQVVAAYNGGPFRLKSRRWNINNMSYITRNHVKKVRNALEELEKTEGTNAEKKYSGHEPAP